MINIVRHSANLVDYSIFQINIDPVGVDRIRAKNKRIDLRAPPPCDLEELRQFLENRCPPTIEDIEHKIHRSMALLRAE